MKILLDCSPLSVGGGVQVGLSVIHNAVADRSLEVHLIASEQVAAQLTEDQIKKLTSFQKIEKKTLFGKFSQGRKISRIEQEINPDVTFAVFGPSYWRSKSVNIQGFALGKMLYPDSRSTYKSAWSRWKEQATDQLKKILLLRNVDYFLTETEVVKTRLAVLLKVPADRIYVVGNSYSPAFEQRCIAKFNNPKTSGDIFSIFVPASFYNHKNLEIIPAAAAVLARKSSVPTRFIFTIDAQSSGWVRIMQLASKHGVAELFSTVGTVPNQYMADHYLQADAVLCTSLVESSTAVFPEAFMAGRPLLVSDLDFARQLCSDAALYFDPHDPKAIANQILALIDSPVLGEALKCKGKIQLRKTYPSPAEKWQQQLAVLKAVAARGR